MRVFKNPNLVSGGLRGDSWYADGMCLDEIADRLGLSRNQVKWILKSAMLKMRKYFQERPESEKIVKDLLTRPQFSGKISGNTKYSTLDD